MYLLYLGEPNSLLYWNCLNCSALHRSCLLTKTRPRPPRPPPASVFFSSPRTPPGSLRMSWDSATDLFLDQSKLYRFSIWWVCCLTAIRFFSLLYSVWIGSSSSSESSESSESSSSDSESSLPSRRIRLHKVTWGKTTKLFPHDPWLKQLQSPSQQEV